MIPCGKGPNILQQSQRTINIFFLDLHEFPNKDQTLRKIHQLWLSPTTLQIVLVMDTLDPLCELNSITVLPLGVLDNKLKISIMTQSIGAQHDTVPSLPYGVY